MILRPYQSKALDEIRRHYSRGVKKVLLWLPTGAGKTLCFCRILKSAYEKGSRAIMVVSGSALVDQASKRLDREGVPHGVMQANHWRNRPDELIQICSIHTLYRRKIVPDAALIVIDEAHLAASPSFKWLIEHYPDAYFLPVTATPYVKNGMRHIADEIVHPITMKELIESGYLVPPKYFAPSRVDLSGVKIDKKTNDYVQAQLAEAVSSANILGDIIGAYKKMAKGRPAICFAVSIEHSLSLKDNFIASGIRAEHIEANTPMDERQRHIDRLEKGELDIICNVGCLTTGVDIPSVSCIILARPTKSYNLYIQMLGRGTRTHQGKDNFIVLDHVNNILEHGFIEIENDVDLDGAKPREKKESIIICAQCFHAFPRLEYDCPACGYDNAPEEREIAKKKLEENKAYEMREMVASETQKIINFVDEYIEIANQNKYKPGWVFYKVKNKYGETIAKAYWKKIKTRILQNS